MDPIRNPFVPGAGRPPLDLVGREGIIEQGRVALARMQAGRYSRSFIAVGLRGVGKTALLVKLREMAEQLRYRSIVLEAREDRTLPDLLLPELRKLLLGLDRLGAVNESVRASLRVFAGFIRAFRTRLGEFELSLDIEAENGTADSGDLEADLPELFVSIGRAARSRGVAIGLFFDELQYLSSRDMSALIMALHRISQDNLPILMVGAGLPQILGLAGKSKSYAERLFEYPRVDPLSATDAARALVDPARNEGADFEPHAIAEIMKQSRGYPYFIQEWGYQAWNSALGTIVSAADVRHATPLALRRLDEGFFRVRFDRLTPRERDYLYAMALMGEGPHRSGDIATTLSVPVQSIAPVRAALIKKGMVFSPAHGDTAFTVPLFDEFMLRVRPASEHMFAEIAEEED